MNITTPMKVVLALVIIVLMGVGFFLLDYQSKFSKAKQLDDTLKSKQAQYANDENLVKALPELSSEKERLQTELNEVIRFQLGSEPIWAFVPSFLVEVEGLVNLERTRMNDPEFALISLTPGALTQGGGEGEAAATPEAAAAEGEASAGVTSMLKSYPTRMFQLTLKGKYATLIDFLNQLGALRLKRLVTINKISLTPSGEAKGGGSPSLQIVIPLTAYFHGGAEGAGGGGTQ